MQRASVGEEVCMVTRVWGGACHRWFAEQHTGQLCMALRAARSSMNWQSGVRLVASWAVADEPELCRPLGTCGMG